MGILPNWIVCTGNPTKMDDLGVPPFQEIWVSSWCQGPEKNTSPNGSDPMLLSRAQARNALIRLVGALPELPARNPSLPVVRCPGKACWTPSTSINSHQNSRFQQRQLSKQQPEIRLRYPSLPSQVAGSDPTRWRGSSGSDALDFPGSASPRAKGCSATGFFGCPLGANSAWVNNGDTLGESLNYLLLTTQG